MINKTILITGSTSGIGLAGAEELGRQGWRVLVHARNETRGLPILDQLKQTVPTGRFELVTGDLASLKEVAALAEQVINKAPVLDVLWNNAGGMSNQKVLSRDGIEWQMAVNHLAPFVLVKLLLPALRMSEQGRVIATSSMAHAFVSGQIDPWFGDSDAKYRGFAVYSKTKLANVLFTQHLALRLEGSKVTTHAYHPGFVKSGFGSSGGKKKLNAMSVAAALFASSPTQGADTGVFLATQQQAASTNGLYWAKCRPVAPSKLATAENAQRLWDQSEQVVSRILG